MTPGASHAAPCSSGETGISSCLIANYLLSGVGIAALWLKGGHPERTSAVLMVLVMPVHASMLLSLEPYSDLPARGGLGIPGAVTLLAGASERWRAGERAISQIGRKGPRETISANGGPTGEVQEWPPSPRS